MSYKIQVIPSFEKRVKVLAKKFRNIKQDLKRAVSSLEQDPFAGVAIPGYEGAVWKLRVANTSARKGKSGGFRIIYLIEESTECCYLLTIYSKTEQESITAKELELLLADIWKEDFSKSSDSEENL